MDIKIKRGVGASLIHVITRLCEAVNTLQALSPGPIASHVMNSHLLLA